MQTCISCTINIKKKKNKIFFMLHSLELNYFKYLNNRHLQMLCFIESESEVCAAVLVNCPRINEK